MIMDMLDRLPYDIWHIIFQLACTDGGRTGCALALTSKACRRASSSARLNSVRLHSLRHVRNFLICLERIRRSTGEDPPVRHLLFFLFPETCDAPVRALRAHWTDYARNERAMLTQLVNEHREWNAKKIAWNRAFVLHVSALLARVADTLRTLLVLQSREVRLPLVRCRLPALRELTLLGDDRMFVRVPRPGILVPREGDDSDFALYDVPLPSADGPEGAPFPALRRLHVVYALPKLHPWEDTLPRWAALAPAVTHLRISQGSAQVAQMIRDMLGLPPPLVPLSGLSGGRNAAEDGDGDSDVPGSPESSAVAGPTYPSLRLVIVQLSRAPKWASSATAAAVLAQRREVEQVAEACADADGGASQAWVSVLRSRQYDDEYWPRRLLREWRQRMSGGGGCWTEDEYYEDERWGVSEVGPLPKREGPLTLDLRNDGPEERKAAKKWWQAVFSLRKRKAL
ncbi:uncharacterized protein TRAVEDRAFT_43459 [Trametes versicolor FP-101664 SS1]|uniref:uncharacterized protein n=1 Tax=Trametes versicolor (strain FP-101664) TaxID=717944 RepID=UPI0004621967|nr:uncharacterized protein TRAVEDRAFT_43459 [Trametes versicolor FP-101664 SS1]EIW63152.1 hypothetical protein TRAVEDRAFT_43459 [Trametes versicolor FP-101664 SS1]